MNPQLKWICILIIAVLMFGIKSNAQKHLTVLPVIVDSARLATGSVYTAYNHDFPIFYDAFKKEYYIERKVSKSGRVTRWKLKVK